MIAGRNVLGGVKDKGEKGCWRWWEGGKGREGKMWRRYESRGKDAFGLGTGDNDATTPVATSATQNRRETPDGMPMRKGVWLGVCDEGNLDVVLSPGEGAGGWWE